MFGLFSMQSQTMKPSDIRYSQNQIRSHFVHGTSASVTSTLERLLKQEIAVSDIKAITVRQHNEDDDLKDKYFAVDGHRRLYIFKVSIRMYNYLIQVDTYYDRLMWEPNVGS